MDGASAVRRAVQGRPSSCGLDDVSFWGSRSRKNGRPAIGIEEQIAESLAGWRGSAVFAEWGYERNPELELKLPIHGFCDRVTQGAVAGARTSPNSVSSTGSKFVVPLDVLGGDQPGVADLLQVRRSLATSLPSNVSVPLDRFQEDVPPAIAPSLATRERDIIAIYFPASGVAALKEPIAGAACSFDPRSGALMKVWSRGK